MTVRSVFLAVHRYLGLLAAIPLLLLGVSGAMLVFEQEIDRAINPGYWNVRPQSQLPSLPWQAVVDAARKAYLGDQVTSFIPPPAPYVAAGVALKGGLVVTIDPYTGKVLGARRGSQTFVSRMHQFHKNLLVGEWGSRVMGTSALLCVVLSLTGIVLWWRRRVLAIKWSASWRRVNYDAHHAVGILGLLPWLILSLTGAAIAFESVVRPAIYRLTNSAPSAQPVVRSTPSPGAKPMTVDAALDVAGRTLPGARTVVMTLPGGPTGTFMAYMKFPEDYTPAGRSRVAFDQFTGSVLWVENSRTAATGTRLWNKNRMVHTGDIYGWPTRILASCASLLLAVQGVSGAWMWWGRGKSPPVRGAARNSTW